MNLHSLDVNQAFLQLVLIGIRQSSTLVPHDKAALLIFVTFWIAERHQMVF